MQHVKLRKGFDYLYSFCTLKKVICLFEKRGENCGLTQVVVIYTAYSAFSLFYYNLLHFSFVGLMIQKPNLHTVETINFAWA